MWSIIAARLDYMFRQMYAEGTALESFTGLDSGYYLFSG